MIQCRVISVIPVNPYSTYTTNVYQISTFTYHTALKRMQKQAVGCALLSYRPSARRASNAGGIKIGRTDLSRDMIEHIEHVSL